MKTTSLVLVLALVGGCGGDDDPADTGVIGPAGGSVSGAGIALTIPAGALDADVEIGITDTGGDAPDGFTASSPIFRFTPEGLSFAVPIAVSVDFTGAADGVALIWSLPSGDGFESLGGSIEVQTVTGQVSHFSEGFAGLVTPDDGCGGGPACGNGLVCLNGQCVAPP